MNEMYARLIKAIQLRDSTDEHAILRAVLEAMREPTEEMLEAGILNYNDDPNFKCATHKSYTAMIDEILK